MKNNIRCSRFQFAVIFSIAIFLSACGSGGGGGGTTSTNTPPVANAGIALSVSTGTLVTLNGSTSSDANNDALTYSWTLTSKPAGSTAILTGATTVQPIFTPDLSGSYQFSLVVNDGKASSAPALVTINSISSFNRLQTEKLKGNWTFNYTIISNWTDLFTLASIFESTTTPGSFYIMGTDQYGRSVIGSYSPTLSSWSVLDTGSIIDQYYVFQTNGSNVLSGCYYQISHPSETWSSCYSLSGSKTLIVTLLAVVTAISVQSEASSAQSKELSDQMHANEVVWASPPPTNVLEEYNHLKNH